VAAHRPSSDWLEAGSLRALRAGTVLNSVVASGPDTGPGKVTHEVSWLNQETGAPTAPCEGDSIGEVADFVGIPPTTVSHWVALFHAKRSPGFSVRSAVRRPRK